MTILIILLALFVFMMLLGSAGGSLLTLVIGLGLLAAGVWFVWDLIYKGKNKTLEDHISWLQYSKEYPYGKTIKIEDWSYLTFRLKEEGNYTDGDVIYSWAGEDDKSMKLSDISCCLFYENGTRTKYCGVKNADPIGKPSYEYYIRLFSKDFKEMDFSPGKKETAYEAYEAFEYILTQGKSSEKCPFEYFNNTQDTE